MNTDINKFIDACIEKGKGEDAGDVDSDRLYYEIIVSVYNHLKDSNRLIELIDLLEHENPYVRLWAASYCLQIEPSKAKKALKKLTKEKGVMAGFSAKITLNEWNKGTLIH